MFAVFLFLCSGTLGGREVGVFLSLGHVVKSSVLPWF